MLRIISGFLTALSFAIAVNAQADIRPAPLLPIVVDPLPPLTGYPWFGDTPGRFINASARGNVGTNDSTLIVGVVVTGGDRLVLARAVGPTLASFGVAGAISKPKLEIFDKNQNLIASNQGWAALPATERNKIILASQVSGAFPLSQTSLDSVALVLLPPGSYTMVVSGSEGSTGNVLAEIYYVPTISIGSYQRANQPLEPASTAVTSRALFCASEMKCPIEFRSPARAAPAVPVAHL
jgi:hypothetical protein